MLYSRLETADLVGLAPRTLSNYTRPGYSTLERGEDFVVRVWKRGPWVRRTLSFTERGLRRLRLRQYQVFRPGVSNPRAVDFLRRAAATPAAGKKNGGRPITSYSALERRMRLRDQLHRFVREYLEHPCALPSCGCISHLAGLPRADVIAGLLSDQPRRRWT